MLYVIEKDLVQLLKKSPLRLVLSHKFLNWVQQHSRMKFQIKIYDMQLYLNNTTTSISVLRVVLSYLFVSFTWDISGALFSTCKYMLF